MKRAKKGIVFGFAVLAISALVMLVLVRGFNGSGDWKQVELVVENHFSSPSVFPKFMLKDILDDCGRVEASHIRFPLRDLIEGRGVEGLFSYRVIGCCFVGTDHAGE